jgi:hypothetical protein
MLIRYDFPEQLAVKASRPSRSSRANRRYRKLARRSCPVKLCVMVVHDHGSFDSTVLLRRRVELYEDAELSVLSSWPVVRERWLMLKSISSCWWSERWHGIREE